MVLVTSPEKEIGDQIRKKLGRPYQYGQKIYGKVKYSEQETVIGPGQYGIRIYGIEKYGEATTLHGIYRVRRKRHKFFTAGDKERGEQYIQKEKFHIPSNPQTEPQQANRQTFADAISSWQGLTPTQKQVYNERAKYKNLSGYNLYISEYLLSN